LTHAPARVENLARPVGSVRTAGGAVDDELWLDPDEMRRFGYCTVDLLVDHLTDPRSASLIQRASRDELEARLSAPPPELGTPAEDLLDRLRPDVLPFIARQEHPGSMAFIPSCGTWPGAMGDLIASGANLYAGSWMDGAGPVQLELTVLDWFMGWIGYPPSSGGVLVTGGSAANMTALACAREALLGALGHTTQREDGTGSSIGSSGRRSIGTRRSWCGRPR
jgi:aromatic-L-amino-acid/L-tryptophan decarboxylase